jgi:hypothetical protein
VADQVPELPPLGDELVASWGDRNCGRASFVLAAQDPLTNGAQELPGLMMYENLKDSVTYA